MAILTIPECAVLLGDRITARQLWAGVRSGRFPAQQIGGVWVVDSQRIARLLTCCTRDELPARTGLSRGEIDRMIRAGTLRPENEHGRRYYDPAKNKGGGRR